MRGEQSRLQSTTHGGDEEEDEEEEREGRTTCIRGAKSGCHADVPDATSSSSLTPAVTARQRQPGSLTCSFPCSVSVDCTYSNGTSSIQGQSELRFTQQDTFNSSFSFIQQSLNCSGRTDTTAATPPQQPRKPQTAQTTLLSGASHHSGPSSSPGQAERVNLSLGGSFWRECLWSGREASSDLPDADPPSLDTDVTSSLSVDSDTASASSITSGYESATPACDQGWDNLVKKYEGTLQECLQNNRTHTKVGQRVQNWV